ncbi:uncharacterized protein LOC135501594 [Lineus longissimus]|uniref:uncharacterized protein LOC135501594 n=1 Tax=Lineus longissimus TaxID=88925 RepID=UPI00315C99D6
MSNASNNRDKNKLVTAKQKGVGAEKQHQQPNKQGNHNGGHKSVNGGESSNSKNGSRPQSRSDGNSTNSKNSSNGKDIKGGNGKPSENEQNRENGDIKSGKNSPQSGNNTRRGADSDRKNSTTYGRNSAAATGNDVNGSNGSNSGRNSQSAVSAASNGYSRDGAASEPKAGASRTKSRASGDPKSDDGTSDANDSRTTSRAATSNVGLQRNPRWGRESSGETSDPGKRANSGNIRPSYYNSSDPFGEKVERVMESPRPRNPPHQKAWKQKSGAGGIKRSSRSTLTPVYESPARSERSLAESDESEDDGEKKKCQKCGDFHHLLQSEACDHNVCKHCLPEDVDGINVDTDCPVCHRKFLYGDAPGRSDQPTLNRFHLIKDIYAAIRPTSCQRCEESNQKTEVASCACRDCALYFCEPCADAHNLENFSEGKGWKNHHIFLIEELREQNALPPVKSGPSTAEELLCPKHEDSHATCYCKTCRRAFCAPCREEHPAPKHDFLNELETKVYLNEIISKVYKATSYDVRAFDQFSAAIRMKRDRSEKELSKQKMEVIAKCNELIRAMEKKRDAVVDMLDAHASDLKEMGNHIQEGIRDERRYADAMKKLLGIFNEDDVNSDDGEQADPDYRLLRIGEFVDRNQAALEQTECSDDMIAEVNNICKMQHDVKLLTRKREEIFDLVEDHIYLDTVEDYWLNDEALLAKQHLRHAADNSVCHVGAFRETGLPYYQFLWPITEKYREYYGKETFTLHGNTLQVEEGTTPDLIQSDIFKSKQFQVFVKASSQRLEKTEVQLFRNTEYSRLFTAGTGTRPLSGLVSFRQNEVEKTMSMVSGSKVTLVKDDRIAGRPHVGKGSKVATLDKSGSLFIPFLIGKVVIRSQISDNEEVIHLGSEEHAVMYTFDKEREYLWTVDAADNVVKVYDYRKLAFLYGIGVHD